MFSDVLVALGRSRALDRVIVVSADRDAQRFAGSYGAAAIDGDDHGHNPAARLGIETALQDGAQRALLVPGDCPLLDPEELDDLLAREVALNSALIVPDRHGSGTNALLLTPPGSLEPAFGPGSRERHLERARADGAAAEVVDVPSLALDVDTSEDLEALHELLQSSHGGAAHTRGMLRQLARSAG
jgi:2-phospho-L-lactate guanylyltransferase